MIQTLDIRIIVQDFSPLNLSSTNINYIIPFYKFSRTKK